MEKKAFACGHGLFKFMRQRTFQRIINRFKVVTHAIYNEMFLLGLVFFEKQFFQRKKFGDLGFVKNSVNNFRWV